MFVYLFTYFADVDPGFVLVVGSVAHGQAQLVLNVRSVQIHFLDYIRKHKSIQKRKRIFSVELSETALC